MRNIFSESFYVPKKVYQIIVKRKKDYAKNGSEKVFYYNSCKLEILYDIFWAFEFSGAESIKLYDCRRGVGKYKYIKTFNSVEDFRKDWLRFYGPHANYFVLADRH